MSELPTSKTVTLTATIECLGDSNWKAMVGVGAFGIPRMVRNFDTKQEARGWVVDGYGIEPTVAPEQA